MSNIKSLFSLKLSNKQNKCVLYSDMLIIEDLILILSNFFELGDARVALKELLSKGSYECWIDGNEVHCHLATCQQNEKEEVKCF